MYRCASKSRGFTLIEAIIVLGIVGILAAVAFPAYTNQVQRGYRANARVGLMQLAQFMERFRAANFSYLNADGSVPAIPDAMAHAPTEGAPRYNLSIANASTNSFTVSATPVGWTDALCGDLSLTNLGVKGQALGDSTACWNR